MLVIRNLMEKSLEKLQQLINDYEINPVDVEFIFQYLKKEQISTQLAVRIIKNYEKLKQKIENDHSKEELEKIKEDNKNLVKKIDKLNEQTKKLNEHINEINMKLQNQIDENQKLTADKESLKEEINRLEKEKNAILSKTELIDSEKETLLQELEALKDLHLADFEEEEEKINKLSISIESFAKDLSKLKENEKLTKIFEPLYQVTKNIYEKEIYSFDIKSYEAEIIKYLSELTKIIKEKVVVPISEEKTVSEEKIIETESVPEKKKEKSKTTISKKPKKTTKANVNEKVVSVINLFLEFINEATNDTEFKERVSTICETDEAYRFLGGIAISRLYSFTSKGIDKKKELTDLLEKWKKEGVPW